MGLPARFSIVPGAQSWDSLGEIYPGGAIWSVRPRDGPGEVVMKVILLVLGVLFLGGGVCAVIDARPVIGRSGRPGCGGGGADRASGDRWGWAKNQRAGCRRSLRVEVPNPKKQAAVPLAAARACREASNASVAAGVTRPV